MKILQKEAVWYELEIPPLCQGDVKHMVEHDNATTQDVIDFIEGNGYEANYRQKDSEPETLHPTENNGHATTILVTDDLEEEEIWDNSLGQSTESLLREAKKALDDVMIAAEEDGNTGLESYLRGLVAEIEKYVD